MNDVQRFGRIQVEMCDTFKSKNADYGNSFSQLYQEFGDNGIITAAVQISHKYHRFMNLIKGTPPRSMNLCAILCWILPTTASSLLWSWIRPKKKQTLQAPLLSLRLLLPLHIVQLRSLITASISLTAPSSPLVMLPPQH